MPTADRPLRFRFALTALIAGAAAVAGSSALAATPQDAATAAPRPYTQAFGLPLGQPAVSGPLSDNDARTYAAAFDAVKKGQFGLADAIVQAVQDTSLQGRLQYDKLMHTAYKATYGELKAWLDNYRDQPGADRIFSLAKKRQALEAAAPAVVQASAASGQPVDFDDSGARIASIDTGLAAPTSSVDPKLQMSREAFYGGDTDTAYRLATQSGERWVAGMASFRLGKFDEAFRWFSDLAQDDAQNEWVRSGAAWWAARSGATAGMTEQAGPYLKLAAAAPYTFYGLIAARQLGLDTATTLAQATDPSTLPTAALTRVSETQVRVTPAMLELMQNDARARRAAALAQAGMRGDAGLELRTAMLGAGDPEARKTWRALAASLGASITSPDDLRRSNGYGRFDPAQYDAPELTPRGGYTLEKSLVYAIVRQESRFNADAGSPAGAYGLMQLMPATAAVLMGDARHPVSPAILKKPAENLRLGQDYVSNILNKVDGDLIRAVASYNSGPGTIMKTVARLGADADTLLVIESMPGAQTREYVEKVMSNYWIYRKLWGLPSPSLDAVAAGASRVPAIMDANKGQGAKYARAD